MDFVYASALGHFGDSSFVGILLQLDITRIAFFDFISSFDLVEWSTQGEQHRQEDETVADTKNDDSKPHLEERLENVGPGRGQHYDREECRESTVEYAGAHGTESSSCFEDPLLVIAQWVAFFVILRRF